MNREAWLDNAVKELIPLFTALDIELPPVRVSTGWPSRGGTSLKKRVVGECWKPEVAEDGVSQIFISPMIMDPVLVLSTLVHELIHAWDKGVNKHRGPFVTVARNLGLNSPWTATSPGLELTLTLEELIETIGEYPHSKLTPSIERKVQTTRQLKVECPECGCIVRMTRQWIDKGLPTCACGTDMIESAVKEK